MARDCRLEQGPGQTQKQEPKLSLLASRQFRACSSGLPPTT